ncbi:O-antigen ligase family protein [Curtobacterium ammoniigenes]|uniref:O-antigen ligase family protein n=1 Tax=Curtobacterium ammoniigenes TaxID=395387 RepID=UPI0012EE98BC|nr:O-antigen ligase family protein [Curtobacterium ammoniigenes]
MTNTWPVARGRVSEGEAFWFASTVLFIVFAGDGFPNLLGWTGWAVVCSLAGLWGIAILVRARPPVTRTPRALWIFLGWCLISFAWSHWRAATAASIAAQVLCALMAFTIASTLSWRRILDALSLALRWVVLLSLLLELVVAAVVRHPVAPVWSDYGHRKVPQAFYFSRADLFTGGQIQGLPGNSNLLAMVALLAAIAVGVQWADGRLRRNRAIGWLVLATLTLALTRSATVLVATVVTALVLAAAVLIRRIPTERRTRAYLGALIVALALAAVAWVGRTPILHLLGKSSTLTGRAGIWQHVWDLAKQHPVIGWGWIGYWWPNVAPLDHLVVRKGVTYLQAHDAYLDLWMQVGVIGMALFIVYVVTTLGRGWASATRFSYTAERETIPFSAVSLFGLLIATALVVQSLTESRLLYEGNWILFAVIAVKSRIVLVGEEPPSLGDGPRTPGTRRAFRTTVPLIPGATAGRSGLR